MSSDTAQGMDRTHRDQVLDRRQGERGTDHSDNQLAQILEPRRALLEQRNQHVQ